MFSLPPQGQDGNTSIPPSLVIPDQVVDVEEHPQNPCKLGLDMVDVGPEFDLKEVDL